MSVIRRLYRLANVATLVFVTLSGPLLVWGISAGLCGRGWPVWAALPTAIVTVGALSCFTAPRVYSRVRARNEGVLVCFLGIRWRVPWEEVAYLDRSQDERDYATIGLSRRRFPLGCELWIMYLIPGNREAVEEIERRVWEVRKACCATARPNRAPSANRSAEQPDIVAGLPPAGDAVPRHALEAPV
ncbi:MAG: hypothetical protein ACE5O2_08785, partial [Armatimonadota bacterium]